MNRKQRRSAQAQSSDKDIRFLGKSYSMAEASALALEKCNLGNYQAAANLYALLTDKDPAYAEAHNNLGCVLRELGRYDEAVASFSNAVHLKPDYAVAHNNCGATLQLLGKYAEALESLTKALALKPDYAMAYNNQCTTLQSLGRYEDALLSCNKAISIRPDYAEAYNNRGTVFHEMRDYTKALENYDKAIALRPDYPEAYNNRGATLLELQRSEEALANYDKAIALKPGYAEAYNNRSVALQQLKLYDEALADSDKAIALIPNYPEAHNNRGDILASIGDMRGAEAMFARALALNPDYANALFRIVHIRKYKDATHTDITRAKQLLAKPGASAREKELLYFCLGKMLDDCGLYDEAFENYRQANLLCNEAVSYNAEKETETTNQLIKVFSREFLAQAFAFSSPSSQPLFIVGMPRSGTTLLASILANHPSIDTAGELPTMRECAAHIRHYPQAVTHMTDAVAAPLIHAYETRLQRDVAPAIPYIIDKHPMNFLHLGLITMLFPKARIIHCTRNPFDTALSNYFQRFSPSYDYSFDLHNIAHYYREYTRLMEHWRMALPSPMFEASYESMVQDTEAMARRLTDFLELEWDERCLVPHTNTKAVETASKWQVRQPIYKQSVERWRRYESHIGPLQGII